ncbi:hypothetical protein DRN52_02325 [Thermococci archaeon]|nr:MAG: hypothetical protein DRN52_02325 [Thermococci archaeon]
MDALAIGNMSLDEVEINGKKRTQLGGASAYVSSTLKLMGIKKVGILSNVGKDFPEEFFSFLKRIGVDVTLVSRNEKSTRFYLKYSKSWRRDMKLISRAPNIGKKDVSAKLIYLGPIAGELDANSIFYYRRRCEILSLDLQGFLRDFTDSGEVLLKENPEILSPSVDVIKGTLEEFQTFDLSSILEFNGMLLVTMGEKGSMLIRRSEAIFIPTYEADVLDPTGAGDVYLGAFLSQILLGRDYIRAACIASSVASISVEKEGVMSSINYGEVKRRYEEILKGIRRLDPRELL